MGGPEFKPQYGQEKEEKEKKKKCRTTFLIMIGMDQTHNEGFIITAF
jgi:hypothetical protein